MFLYWRFLGVFCSFIQNEKNIDIDLFFIYCYSSVILKNGKQNTEVCLSSVEI